MAGKAADLVGQKFGLLTVESRAGSQGNKATWNCVCDCGGSNVVTTGNLRSGIISSCGCLAKPHGMSRTRIYRTWKAMLGRCNSESHKAYPLYGGRGIKVCSRWHDFRAFYADMGDLPAGKSLDRIDNDGDYSPENCRWATHEEQGNNRRTNHLLTFNGKTQTCTEWAHELGMNPYTLNGRLSKGWSAERALTTPVRAQGALKIEYQGRTWTLQELAATTDIHPEALRYRIEAGWPIEKALTQKSERDPSRKKANH